MRVPYKFSSRVVLQRRDRVSLQDVVRGSFHLGNEHDRQYKRVHEIVCDVTRTQINPEIEGETDDKAVRDK
jgi:hypothetical protein